MSDPKKSDKPAEAGKTDEASGETKKCETQHNDRAVKFTAVVGKGYGSSHGWWRGVTIPTNPYWRWTEYRCWACGERFVHHYSETPDIFQAIKDSGAPDQCPRIRDSPKGAFLFTGVWKAWPCADLAKKRLARDDFLDMASVASRKEASLKHTPFRHIADFLETGARSVQLADALTRFNYTQVELDAYRAAGAKSCDLATELVARGMDGAPE